MAIEFKTVKWRNFLSTGTTPIEIQLNRTDTTLIVGHNGAGKSTLLDALSFSLFGKPHRPINKPQLMNSINNKQCEVEVEFKIGSHEFKVVRGMKPNKFEIYQNGHMINQNAAAKDYQKFLEQNILKLNHKSFHQIVVLGSSSFVPFMQLPAHTRRDVIEDLLDIGIFSKMNQILKERIGKLKDNLTDNNYQLDLAKEKIAFQRKYVKDITDLNEEQVRVKNDKIEDYQSQINEIQRKNAELSEYIETHRDEAAANLRSTQRKNTKMVDYIGQFKMKMKDITEEAEFFESNDNCPTCYQSIDEGLKSDRITASKKKAKDLNNVMIEARAQMNTLTAELAKLEAHNESIKDSQTEINNNNKTIMTLQTAIQELENEIKALSETKGDLGEARNDLDGYINDRDALSERKLQLLDMRNYNDAAYEMLKDSGIKTKIIKEYLPIMNKLINNYLQIMEFFVSFNLDENFNETIKSRYRDNFNYASFSEGEKMRIDLSLLFAWRQIAKMKNSTNTNLLILDETFDSSMDHEGVDHLLKIIQSFGDQTNVFVISHKTDQLDGKFRAKIEFQKERNFSAMKMT